MNLIVEREGHVCPALTPKQIERGMRKGKLHLTELGLERVCGHCGELLPLDTEFWRYMPRASTGVHSWCKACAEEEYGRAGRKAKAVACN